MCALGAFAQPDEGAVWKGELHSDTQARFDGYIAQLVDSRRHETISTDIRSDGSFEFRHVTNGDYQLVVSDGLGRNLCQNFVHVPGNSGTVQVRLPDEKVERPPSGAVSFAQLLHPPARKAIERFAAAQQFSESRQYARAAAELEKAVQISPDYADAHNNLGAQYLRLGRYQEALDELEKAMRIAQPSPITLSNLAYAYLMLSHCVEAADSARKALGLAPDCTSAHYVLGMALVMSAGPTPEAIGHLEKAAAVMPGARVNLERLRAQLAVK